MKNWQSIPTTCLTLGGEVMVPTRSDNSTLAISTELFNYIIAFAIQGKSGHYKIFDGCPRGFLFATLIKICYKVLKCQPRSRVIIISCHYSLVSRGLIPLT